MNVSQLLYSLKDVPGDAQVYTSEGEPAIPGYEWGAYHAFYDEETNRFYVAFK